VSGVRGKVVLKIFGTDLEKMRASLERPRRRSPACPASSTSTCTRLDGCRSSRSCSDRGALARAGDHGRRRPDVVETAARRQGRDQHVEERLADPGPGRPAAPEALRSERVAALRVPTADGGRVPCARSPGSASPRAAPRSTRGQPAGFMAAQVQRRGPRRRLGDPRPRRCRPDAGSSRPTPLTCVGPASREPAAARWPGCAWWCRSRCSWCSCCCRALGSARSALPSSLTAPSR